MNELERDIAEFRERIKGLPRLWTHIRLRAVLGQAGSNWLLLGTHADFVYEKPEETLDISDVNMPRTVRLIEDVRPFSDLDAILSGLENGGLSLRDVPVMIRGFKGAQLILARGRNQQYVIPADVRARWTDSWPSLVFSLGAVSFDHMGFEEDAVNRELNTGDFDHRALYELTRDAIGFQLGGSVQPHIYIVAPIYIALSSAISPQRISFVVKSHRAVRSSDVRVRIAESGDSERFRRSVSADALDICQLGIWRKHAHNLQRPEGVNSVSMRLVFKGETIDGDLQALEAGPGTSHFVHPWQNVKLADSHLGMLEFRYPTWTDELWVARQLETQDARTFTCQVLAHQVVGSHLDTESLRSMDDGKLVFLAEHFVEGVDTLRSEFERTVAASYFDDFRHLFESRLQSVRADVERIQKSMEALVGDPVSQALRALSEGPLRCPRF